MDLNIISDKILGVTFYSTLGGYCNWRKHLKELWFPMMSPSLHSPKAPLTVSIPPVFSGPFKTLEVTESQLLDQFPSPAVQLFRQASAKYQLHKTVLGPWQSLPSWRSGDKASMQKVKQSFKKLTVQTHDMQRLKSRGVNAETKQHVDLMVPASENK